MRKKPKAEPLWIGIDARLAYRRGVGTYVANLVLSLSQIDRENRYSLFNAPSSLKSQVKNSRFSFEEVPFSNAAYYEQVLLPRAARSLGLDFLHYVDNSGAVLGGFPFVLTLHDAMHSRSLSAVRSGPSLRQRMIHFYKRWAIPRSALKARAVLTVSQYSKTRILEEIPVEASKVFVTLEGVNARLFKRLPRKKTKLFKILVHGAADERKNIPGILQAAKILKAQGKTFQMMVIGMDEAELKRTNYIQLCADGGLGRQVEWAGSIPFELLNQVYAESDLFLYPSLLEGFGLPVLEAFVCGVPVVTSNSSSLPEVAGDAALLVDSQSPEAIAGAVRQVMEKPALSRRLVVRGLRRSKQFTWEKMAGETLKVYEGMKL